MEHGGNDKLSVDEPGGGLLYSADQGKWSLKSSGLHQRGKLRSLPILWQSNRQHL